MLHQRAEQIAEPESNAPSHNLPDEVADACADQIAHQLAERLAHAGIVLRGASALRRGGVNRWAVLPASHRQLPPVLRQHGEPDRKADRKADHGAGELQRAHGERGRVVRCARVLGKLLPKPRDRLHGLLRPDAHVVPHHRGAHFVSDIATEPCAHGGARGQRRRGHLHGPPGGLRLGRRPVRRRPDGAGPRRGVHAALLRHRRLRRLLGLHARRPRRHVLPQAELRRRRRVGFPDRGLVPCDGAEPGRRVRAADARAERVARAVREPDGDAHGVADHRGAFARAHLEPKREALGSAHGQPDRQPIAATFVRAIAGAHRIADDDGGLQSAREVSGHATLGAVLSGRLAADGRDPVLRLLPEHRGANRGSIGNPERGSDGGTQLAAIGDTFDQGADSSSFGGAERDTDHAPNGNAIGQPERRSNGKAIGQPEQDSDFATFE